MQQMMSEYLTGSLSCDLINRVWNCGRCDLKEHNLSFSLACGWQVDIRTALNDVDPPREVGPFRAAFERSAGRAAMMVCPSIFCFFKRKTVHNPCVMCRIS